MPYTAAKSKGRLLFLCIKSVLSLMEHSFNSQIHKGLLRVCPKYTINQSFIIKKNKNMKKVIFRILPAVILFVSAIVVLGGCEKSEVQDNFTKELSL